MNEILIKKEEEIENKLKEHIIFLKEEFEKSNIDLKVDYNTNSNFRFHCYDDNYEDWVNTSLDFVNSISRYKNIVLNEFSKKVISVIFRNLDNLCLIKELQKEIEK